MPFLHCFCPTTVVNVMHCLFKYLITSKVKLFFTYINSAAVIWSVIYVMPLCHCKMLYVITHMVASFPLEFFTYKTCHFFGDDPPPGFVKCFSTGVLAYSRRVRLILGIDFIFLCIIRNMWAHE